jgi:hypothetical protein
MSKPKRKLCRTARWIRRYRMHETKAHHKKLRTSGFPVDLFKVEDDVATVLATMTLTGSVLSLRMACRDFIRACIRKPKKQTN